MLKLNINRYLQEPSHCAVASCATAANFYNNKINYDISKEIALSKVVKSTELGLDSGEICLLLNNLGFNKVTMVSSNLMFFDYTWAKFKKEKMLRQIEEAKIKYKGEYKDSLKSIYRWLKNKKFNNNLIISYQFGKYIREHIDSKKPVVLTFNWTMFFKYKKKNAINGEAEEHAVVAYGYNKKGVYICDSHNQYYKYRLKKYRSGLYLINWENLMSIIAFGDVFLPDDYDPRITENYFM
jgi:hypothetical protein